MPQVRLNSLSKNSVDASNQTFVSSLFRRPRRGPEGTADYDSENEDSQRSGNHWRVAVNEQKTENTHGAMELNLSQIDLEAAKEFLAANDPSVQQPFKSATWQRMRTLLSRLIKPEHPRLWEAANRETELGSHEFRRAQMAKIDLEGGTDKDARVRGLGANPLMLHQNYKDPKYQSHRRTQDVLANMTLLEKGGPSSSAAGKFKLELET